MFIGSPSGHLVYGLAELGGVRLIIWRFTARGVKSVIADPLKNYPLGLDTFLEARFEVILAEVRAMKDPK